MENILHLKYRPTTLDDVVSNEEVTEVLRRQLTGESKQALPHALLFHGPTGCGKTTLGRIVARMLGAQGNDLREVDSADFRGIDTIRDIRAQSKYMPLEGPVRVWILDEVHRLTNDAQSALLKALEDTPAHVYYILCTTDPQKLLPTIRGRCADFQVRTLTDREMLKLLRRVVKEENESLPKEVYQQIVQDSMGHPRNALQILAHALSVEPPKRLEVAKRAAESQSEVIELCRALTNGSAWKKIAELLKGLKDQDPENIRRAVLGYCQAILLSGQQNDRAAQVMQEFMEPTYNTGFPGVVLACYSALFAE